MSKRILWIFNHTTLRKWEVPFLIANGYEVFCPKYYGVDFGDLSTSVTYEYDTSLSIPDKDIEYFNKIDFYKELDPETIDYINRYFDMVFCIVGREPLRSLLLGYTSGPIVVQCFGMMGDFSFSNGMSEVYGHEMLTLIERVGNRFWFAAGYDNISRIEPDVIKRRAIYMPVSFPKSAKEEWVGGDKRILFVAPKIKTSSYYRDIYEKFNDELGDIPHVIGGAQLISVETDDTVAGFLSYEDYVYNMTHLAGMFYHSQEPRHIHYHPLEAIQRGMPLIFMAGGMLDNLGGIGLPGRCISYKEAHHKLKRLSEGDYRLRKKILKTQDKLLEKVSNNYCEDYWKRGLDIIEHSTSKVETTKKKLGIVLPNMSECILTDFVYALVKSLAQVIERKKMPIEIVLGYSQHNFNDNGITSIGVSNRPFKEKKRDSEWVENVLTISGYEPQIIKLYSYENVIELADGMRDFGDCDYVIIANETVGKYPVFLKTPHAILAHSFVDRYFDLSNYVNNNSRTINICAADKVLVYNKSVYDDVLQLGVPSERVIMLSSKYLVPQATRNTDNSYSRISIIVQEEEEQAMEKVIKMFSKDIENTAYEYTFLILSNTGDKKREANCFSSCSFNSNSYYISNWRELNEAVNKTDIVIVPEHSRYEHVLVDTLSEMHCKVISYVSPETADNMEIIKCDNGQNIFDFLKSLKIVCDHKNKATSFNADNLDLSSEQLLCEIFKLKR